MGSNISVNKNRTGSISSAMCTETETEDSPIMAGKKITFEGQVNDLNGLTFNNHFIPEEILIHILSFLSGKELLQNSAVCVKWYIIIKGEGSVVWRIKYKREFEKVPKKLPWEVFYLLFTTNYFDKNLIKNPNGKSGLKHWTVHENGGNGWKVEKRPIGAKPLPENTPALAHSCFATSYDDCSKRQIISFAKNKLLCHILDTYQPEIYMSEWYTGRFDCGCLYKLKVSLLDESRQELHSNSLEGTFDAFADPDWKKESMVFKNYGPGVRYVCHFHMGRDTQFWRGNYGSKIAGSSCMLLFDSINPQDEESEEMEVTAFQ